MWYLYSFYALMFQEQIQAFLQQTSPMDTRLGQPHNNYTSSSPADSPTIVEEEQRTPPLHNHNTRSGNKNRYSMYQETHFGCGEEYEESNIYCEPDSVRASEGMATPQYKGHPHSLRGNDISVQYYGRMPRKGAFMSMSRDSGVNCIGMEPSSSRLQSRSRSSGKRSHSTGRTQKQAPPRASSPIKHQAMVHQPPGGAAMHQDSGFSSPRTDGDYGQFRGATSTATPPGGKHSNKTSLKPSLPAAASSGKKGRLKARLASRESIYITGSDFYPTMAPAGDEMLEASACIGASGESPHVNFGPTSPSGASAPHPADASGPDHPALRDTTNHVPEISPQHRKTATSREHRELPPSKGSRRRDKESSKRHSMYLDNGYGLPHERHGRDSHPSSRHLRKSKESESRLSFLDDCQVVGVVWY